MIPAQLGIYVRYDATNGSTGKVVELITYGPFKNDHGVYVEWVYGRDANGEVIKSTSAFHGRSARAYLVLTTAEEYIKVRDRKFK